MDKEVLGRRLAQAREDAGVTQEALARAVGLDRTAVVRLEKGERRLSVPELVAVAEVLRRPLAFFVAEPL
ncbi:MAG: helix-turn-helix domain-containing protein, partial [Micrococcales bacterium]|nr:helix-turn-helix domain-containing protein [Micrococcales bacterium]